MSSRPVFTVFLAEEGALLLRLQEYASQGGDLSARRESDGRTLLLEAFDRLDMEALIFLSDRGVDLDAPVEDGTLLHAAVEHDLGSAYDNGLEPIMAWTRLVLWLGADDTVRDGRGRTPRELAASYGVPALELFDAAARRERRS
jgi:hypothetical protein